MTLNASGPLSFGGATTGQSINLELGVSATALASINSTSFRTLANVPSGQISVSNFYGKSNSFGWISFVDGTGNLRATQAAFFADASGNTYFSYKGGTSADYSALARIDVNGATATYLRPWADDFNSVVVPATATMYTSAGNFWACARISDLSNFPFSTLNTSLGYVSGKKTGSGTSYPSNVAMTPDGRVYILGRYIGKSQEARVFAMNTSGTAVGGWLSNRSSSYNSGLAPRTDNSAVWVYKTGQDLSWDYLPAGGGNPPTGGKASYAWSDGGYAVEYAGADSSNNIFAITAEGRIFRISSAGNNVIGRIPVAGAVQSRMSVYGSFVYVLTTNSNYSGTNLYCYDTATLTPQWRNTFTFSNNNCASNGLNANATGIYAFFNNNVHGQFIMKIPLTGVPANGTKALTAPSGLSFTYTTSSFSATSLAFGTPIGNTYMYSSPPSLNSTSAYPAGGTTAPNNQNTPL